MRSRWLEWLKGQMNFSSLVVDTVQCCCYFDVLHNRIRDDVFFYDSISYCSNIVPLLTTDECFDEIHECDHLAKCKNTPGNYTCQCPDGYLSQWKDCIGKGQSVYSCFKKGCRKKCTRQSRKVLWVVLSLLFFKEIWKNGTRGHGHMFASASGNQQK